MLMARMISPGVFLAFGNFKKVIRMQVEANIDVSPLHEHIEK